MRLYLYQLKNLLKSKEIMFWTMAFPIILGTLFYVSFGTASVDENFAEIPVGVVWIQENEIFKQVINQVSDREKDEEKDSGENQETMLFKATDMTRQEAEKALQKEKIEAIIIVGDDISMEVKKSSINASIVESFLNQYTAMVDTFETILKDHPEQLEKLIASFVKDTMEESEKQTITIKDDSFDDKDYNPNNNYFYALIAMTCLFGSMFTQKSIEELQADQSPLGARRNVAPTKKTVLLMIDILAAWTIQFLELCITLVYLAGILKIDFGENIFYMVLMAFFGSYFGNSFGMFIGTIVKGEVNKKIGIIISVSLVSSFFGGLMMRNMINIVEQNFPIFNRINPAALIVNAFHGLAIYNNTAYFYQNVITLVVFALIMNIVSVVVVRRKKYASI